MMVGNQMTTNWEKKSLEPCLMRTNYPILCFREQLTTIIITSMLGFNFIIGSNFLFFCF